MQALNNFFEHYTEKGINNFLVKTEKLPNGSFEFSLEPLGVEGKPLSFILTKSGLTPIDNRGILG